MKIEDLIAALRRLKVQTGSLACLGCRHEHNCSTSGCAIIREAIEVLRDASWISVADRLPDDDVMVLCIVSGRPQTNITLDEAMEIASHSRTEGGSWRRGRSGMTRRSPTGCHCRSHQRRGDSNG